jgi:ABC-type lipoprotein export system ATPase subunit
MEALLLNNLYKIYKEGMIETVALRGAELKVNSGEFVAITGRSGAGKSTLLNLIGGLAIPSAGQVVIDGEDITRMKEGERAAFRRDHIGIVYQMDVILPMQVAKRRRSESQAVQLLEEVGLIKRLNHKPAQLSGGERQRVAIAVALANEPSLLLADELTGELDSQTADKVMDILGALNTSRKLTLVVVTHNKTVAARARRQVKIADGKMYEDEVTRV